MDLSGLVHIILVLFCAAVIFALLYWLVKTCPWIPETWRPGFLWVITAIVVLFLIFTILIPLANGGPVGGWLPGLSTHRKP